MLTKGSKILIREDGQRANVEALQISDLVFDPLKDQYVEIVDILRRKVLFSKYEKPQDHPLYPSLIRHGSVSTNRPNCDLLTSPNQPILATFKSGESGGYPELTKVRAREFVSRSERRQANVEEIEYFAVFTNNPQTFDVSGVLVSGYSSDVYEQSPSDSRQVQFAKKTRSQSINTDHPRVLLKAGE